MDVTYRPKSRKRVSSPYRDKRIFSKTASRTHRVNTMMTDGPMRGGIRL